MNGYVKLHRDILENGIFNNANLLKTFIWCLARATYKLRKTYIGSQEIELRPGQLITGRKSASIELNLTEQVVRTNLKALQKLGTITLEATQKYTIITVNNWNFYQNEDIESVNKSIEDSERINQIKPKNETVNEVEIETEKSKIQPKDNHVLSLDNQDIHESKSYVTNQQITNKQPSHNQEITTNKKEEKNIRNKESKKNKHLTTTSTVVEENVVECYTLHPDTKNIVEAFSNVFGLLNMNAVTTISDYLKIGFKPDLIQKSLEIAIANNARRVEYALSICRDWYKRGYRSLEDYVLNERNNKNGISIRYINRNENNGESRNDKNINQAERRKTETELRYESYKLTAEQRKYLEEVPF